MNFLPVRVVAICDRDESLACHTASQYGARAYTETTDMYRNEQLDAVFLSVSPQLHPRVSVRGVRRRRLHVFMEKPPATRVAGLTAMLHRRKRPRRSRWFQEGIYAGHREGNQGPESRKGEHRPVLGMVSIYPVAIPQDGRKRALQRQRELLPTGLRTDVTLWHSSLRSEAPLPRSQCTATATSEVCASWSLQTAPSAHCTSPMSSPVGLSNCT